MASAISAEAATTGQSLDAAHRGLLADPSLQFHFAPPEALPPPPEWLQALGKFLSLFGPALNYIFWAGVAIIAALILYAIAREIIRRLPGTMGPTATPEAPAAAEFRPTQARARALLEEADRLAREGRYGEAARVLLHRSIDDIEETFPTLIAPSLTAREIGRLEQLSASGRAVFVKIARAVETSLFGGRPLDAPQFAECRRAYADFVFGAAGQ